MASDARLRVAFDLRRVADFWRRPYPVFGITRYARTLFQALCERTDTLSVTPVAYAPAEYSDLFTLDSTVAQMKRSLQTDILTSWRRRSSLWARTFGVLERATSKGLGDDRASFLSRDVLKRTGLERALFQPRARPLPMRWAVYHAPYGPLPPAQWTGAAARILTVHDCIPYRFPHFYPGTPPPILESVNVETDYVICYSESTRTDLMSIIDIPEESTRVIPIAHQPVFANPSASKARSILGPLGVVPGKFVLALAQPNPRKNIGVLIQAFLRVGADEELRDYHLVLVAPSGHRTELIAELERTAAPLSLFRVISDVDDETLASLYSCATAFAFVSLHEGFGLPPLEAMAAGCPIVVSETSSLPEVVGDAGRYVDPTDCESIATGLRHVMEDRSLREALIARGRRRAAKFSWEKTTTMTIRFYKHAVSDARRRRRE